MRRAAYAVFLVIVTLLGQPYSVNAAGRWEAHALYSQRYTSSYLAAAMWPAVSGEVTGTFRLNPSWELAAGISGSLAGNMAGTVDDSAASGDRGPDSTSLRLQMLFQPSAIWQPLPPRVPLTLKLTLGANTTADHFVGNITEKTSTLAAGMQLAYALPNGMVFIGGAERSLLAYGQILSAPLAVATTDIVTSQVYLELQYRSNAWQSVIGFRLSSQSDLYPNRTLQYSRTSSVYLGCGWNR